MKAGRKKTIAIGSDHAGYAHREAIVRMLKRDGYRVIDYGAFGPVSVDYPDYAHPVADDVENGRADLGIVLCGSGNGVAMTANKHQKIRAALAWRREIARLGRAHNDANVLAIPARFVSERLAKDMVRIFLHTPFEGGRHLRRIKKIPLSAE